MRDRVQHLRGFGHEPDAAKCDHVAFKLLGLARQFQAVADRVGEFLNFGILIMMGQNDRLTLGLSATISSAIVGVVSMNSFWYFLILPTSRKLPGVKKVFLNFFETI